MRGKPFISYYDQALKLLSNRPHAEKELRQKLNILSKKRSNRRIYKKQVQESLPRIGYSSVFVNEASSDDDKEEIESAITKLKEEGYLNDKQFAEWYCLQRQDYNPRSQRVLYLELVTKGVNPAIAKEIIHDYHSEDECCKSIALRKVGCMSHDKLVTYLLGKGFTIDTIKQTLKTLPDFSQDC